MSRLLRKCFAASATFHLLLLASLLVGSAFLRPSGNSTGAPLTERSVIQLSESPPEVKAADTSQQAATTTHQQATAGRDRELAVPPSNWTLGRPQISTNLVTRNPPSGTTAKAGTQRDEQSGTAALEGILRSFHPGSPVSLDIGQGHGAGNDTYAQVVRDIYTRTWNPVAGGVTSEAGTAEVTVTIARDGRVLAKRVLRRSGDDLMDRSVQQTLERVTLLQPFEKAATELQRTYTIRFNVREKLNVSD
jgi:TonB family protein